MGGRARHYRENLTGEHHSCALRQHTLALAPVIIIITVKPSTVFAFDPLRPADVLLDPLCLFPQTLLNRLTAQAYLPARYAVEAAPAVCRQQFPLLLCILIQICSRAEQRLHLRQNLHLLHLPALPKQTNEIRQNFQIIRISRCKSHTLSSVSRHIQGIVPVRAPQTHMIVLAHFVENCQILHKDVFQQRTTVILSRFILKNRCMRSFPGLIDPGSPRLLLILKVCIFF